MILEVLINTDDGEEDYDTTWYPNGYSSNRNTFGHDGSGSCDVGLLFDDTDISPDAVITNAKLKVKCAINSTKRPTLKIRGILQADPDTWAQATRPSTRPKTTASVDWDIGEDWALNTWYESPDISSIINEIIGQEGFSGGAIALVIEDDSSPSNQYELIWDYNNGAADAPELSLTATTQPVIQKSLTYKLTPQLATINIPKQLGYAIESTPAPIQKELRYIVYLGETTIQKALKYCIKTEPAPIQKSLTYCIATTPGKIEKSLRYKVIPNLRIEKQLAYGILTQTTIQKILRYAIDTGEPPTEKSRNQVLKVKRIIAENIDDGREDSDGNWYKDGNASHLITMGNLDGKTHTGAFRFRHVDVPRNAMIFFARLKLRCAYTDGEAFTTKLRIRGLKEPDIKPFSQSNKPSDKTKTVDSVSWEIYKQWNINEWVQTPNLLLVVQELVRQSDWKAGNAMAFVIEDDGSDPDNTKSVWDSSSGEEDKVELEIYYFDRGVDVSFLQLNDRDGEEDYRDLDPPDNEWFPNGWGNNRITLGDDGVHSPESPNDAGFIFSPIYIPPKAKIVSARILLTSDNQNNNICNWIIKGFAEDNAAPFSGDGGNRPSTRPKTNAKAQWFIGHVEAGILLGDHWTAQSVYESPEIKDIIQEIVDREGWAGGASQKLGLVIESHFSQSVKYIADYSKGGAGKWAAQLIIAWQEIRRSTTRKKDLAAYDKANYPEFIIVHHSATARDTTLFITIKNAHIGYGWGDIGYHKWICGAADGDGILKQGRPDNEIGAHCNDNKMNYRSIGACVCGDFYSGSLDEEPTEAQLATLQNLLDDIRKQRRIPKENVLGHKEVLGAATECPGDNLLPYIINYRETGSLT